MNNFKSSLLLALLLISVLTGCAVSKPDTNPFQPAMEALNAGNKQEAFRLFKELAEQGYAVAQFGLAGMYANGEGVAKDNKEAAVWFRKAAEQGNAKGQTLLGLCYRHGQGVPLDDVLAYLWFSMAVANGDKGAVDIRQQLSNLMTPAQIERAQELSRKCSEQNYKNCGT